MRFGISTHLFHGERLTEQHLQHIARHGFNAIEVFATKSHFDYHDSRVIQTLRDWTAEAHLELRSVHAPIVDSLVNDKWGRAYSTATKDPTARKATLDEIAAAIRIAEVIPFRHLVVHLGIPSSQSPGPEDNSRDAVIRTIEEIHSLAEPVGVQLALEVMGNSLSTAPALVDLIERNFDGSNIGICMDVGHAHMLGDVTEAVEIASEYLVTTHIHDNRRQRDDHLVPFEGSINWAATIMAFEKIGYDGVLMYEVRNAKSASAVLERSVAARTRLESLTTDSSQFL